MVWTVWQKLVRLAKIAGWLSTMPWVSLQAAIEQILQEDDIIVQEKQLLEWQARKNAELMNVSVVVSRPHLFSSTPPDNIELTLLRERS
jgi:hypothetical protein